MKKNLHLVNVDVYKRQAMQYPMNMPKIQASRVIRKGDYVFFLMLGYISSEEEELDEEKQVEAFQKQNDIGEKAITDLLG